MWYITKHCDLDPSQHQHVSKAYCLWRSLNCTKNPSREKVERVCKIWDPDNFVDENWFPHHRYTTLWKIYPFIVFKSYSLEEVHAQIFLLELENGECDWATLYDVKEQDVHE